MKKFIVFDTVQISYRVTGKGNPVFLIHGFGEDARIWESLEQHLQDKYTLLIIDLPGTGNSGYNQNLFSMQANANLIYQIIEKEQLGKTVLLGHSMGGYIALAFAAQYPQKLKAIGLLHSTVFADGDEKKAARQKNITFLKQHGTAKFLQLSIPNLFGPDYVRDHKEIVDQQINKNSYINKEVLMAFTEAMLQREDNSIWLQQTVLPVLFIIGKEDKAISFESSLQQCHLPKISYIHILPEVGHMGMLEAEKAFNKGIVNFLRDLEE